MGNKKTTVTVNGGVGFFGALTILFIALKLLDKIDWGWGWVLAPLWMPVAFIVAVIIIMIIIFLLGKVWNIWD